MINRKFLAQSSLFFLYPCCHSLIHPFIYSCFIHFHSLIHLLIHWFIDSFIHSSFLPLIYSCFIHLLSSLFNSYLFNSSFLWFLHSFIHSLIHPFIFFFIHLLIQFRSFPLSHLLLNKLEWKHFTVSNKTLLDIFISFSTFKGSVRVISMTLHGKIILHDYERNPSNLHLINNLKNIIVVFLGLKLCNSCSEMRE